MKRTGIALLVLAPIIALASVSLAVHTTRSAMAALDAAMETADTLDKVKAELNSGTSDLRNACTPLWIGAPIAALSFIAGLALLITASKRVRPPAQGQT